ncbi:oxidative stress-induced growth inhibitor 2 isoform X2 [Hyla sarda]|uniref:oxidative stress-induced growth inhibitor 2 isoform X2 n=1 Tax=Hyla sarda TaxID=327740 RepID=UPI0024C2AB1C|nr:oxidative stress-induced growth inhibitor 2 isoform X2 [Hyla sarda]
MPLAEENPLSRDPPLILPVVIVGNGPSGICLSYMLSGYRPYLSPEALHPNPILHSKLEEARHLSILEQDMEGSILTLSLNDWMELPGLKFKDWAMGKRRNIKSDRATPAEVASYYKHYVKIMGIQRNFIDNTYITSVVRPYRDPDDSVNQDPEEVSCEESHIDKENEADPKKNWEVHGYRRAADGSHKPFCVFAESLVLATGTFDARARLDVLGENLPYVSHSVAEFEEAVGKGSLSGAVDPVLIVGAGLTAADAVLCAHNNNIPVIHAFRRRLNDPSLIFKQLPKKLYPEYHKVYHMMCTQVSSAASTSYPSYTSYPEHFVLSFKPDMKCVLQNNGGLKKVVKISMALVLIGSHPNLFFLKEQGRSLGHHQNQPITCKGNPVEVDPYTYESCKEPSLFALGPLVGDNFIRFLKGGALAITRCLGLRQKKRHGNVESGSDDGVS